MKGYRVPKAISCVSTHFRTSSKTGKVSIVRCHTRINKTR